MNRTRAALVAVVGFAAVWNLVANLVLPDAWYLPANLAAAALVVGVARWAGLSRTELGLGRAELGRGIVVGLGAVLVVAAVLAVALAIPGVEQLLEDDDVASDSTAMRWFLPLVRIPFGTVVFEELLFRSVLLGLLVRWRGERTALWATAVLFGLWHVAPEWGSVDQGQVVGPVLVAVAVTTVAGVLFALLRRWSGSVVAPMLAHTATNSLAYLAAVLALEVL